MLEKKEFIQKAEKAVLTILQKTVSELQQLLVHPESMKMQKANNFYNSAFFLNEGKIQYVQNKTLLPTYDIFDEYRHFEPNREFDIVEYKGEKIAVTICEDLWDELPTANEFGKDKLYQVSPMEELVEIES